MICQFFFFLLNRVVVLTVGNGQSMLSVCVCLVFFDHVGKCAYVVANEKADVVLLTSFEDGYFLDGLDALDFDVHWAIV